MCQIMKIVTCGAMPLRRDNAGRHLATDWFDLALRRRSRYIHTTQTFVDIERNWNNLLVNITQRHISCGIKHVLDCEVSLKNPMSWQFCVDLKMGISEYSKKVLEGHKNHQSWRSTCRKLGPCGQIASGSTFKRSVIAWIRLLPVAPYFIYHLQTDN